MSARLLITSDDERAWKSDRPVLFLGEWCRRFDRRQAWEPLDARVARPVIFSGDASERMHAEVNALVLALLHELAAALNEFHGLRKPVRFWRILLSHWIHRYASAMFHRWHAVRGAREEFDIDGTVRLDSPGFSLAAPESLTFIWNCADGLWNNVLCATIWEHMTGRRAQALPVDAAPSAGPPSPQTRGGLRGVIRAAASALQRDDDALIVNSYLPRKMTALLNLRLGQLPRRHATPVMQPVAVDASCRQRFHVGDADAPGLDGFARRMLPGILPTCFIEGFESLRREAAALDWPKRPRFIFTSNNFDTDEVFKAWTADKVLQGTPYVIGQHGNNYGSARHCPYESEATCVAMSDAFVTWGWREADPRYCPAFIFKTAGMRAGNWKPDGGLLLIELSLPQLVHAWDPYPEFTHYQEEQFRFTGALPEPIRAATTVRLHSQFRRQSWGDSLRWHQREPSLSLDTGQTPIATCIAGSRLVVHSYDSTGILETLALDIPTLAFWSGGLEHVRASAQPYYRALVDAGIVHHTAQDAAAKAAAVWDDVRAWWTGAEVQAARRKFCGHFARQSPAPISELATILKQVAAVQFDDDEKDQR